MVLISNIACEFNFCLDCAWVVFINTSDENKQQNKMDDRIRINLIVALKVRTYLKQKKQYYHTAQLLECFPLLKLAILDGIRFLINKGDISLDIDKRTLYCNNP